MLCPHKVSKPGNFAMESYEELGIMPQHHYWLPATVTISTCSLPLGDDKEMMRFKEINNKNWPHTSI